MAEQPIDQSKSAAILAKFSGAIAVVKAFLLGIHNYLLQYPLAYTIVSTALATALAGTGISVTL